MSKVLVTGGAGYIGANLCKVLLENGFEVRVFDDFSNGLESRLQGMNLEIQKGNILDREALTKAVSGVDSVIHLAAKVCGGISSRTIEVL
jgi:UDP-glucose 4-epimerase